MPCFIATIQTQCMRSALYRGLTDSRRPPVSATLHPCRPSAPDPRGSDRSSGPDPVLTRHPSAERPKAEWCGRLSAHPVGQWGCPGDPAVKTARHAVTARPGPPPRNPCAESERRALVEDASLVRLARAAVRNHSSVPFPPSAESKEPRSQATEVLREVAGTGLEPATSGL